MHVCVCTYAWGTEGVLRNTEESVHETVEVGLGQLWADGKLGTQGRADWYYSVSLKCLRHRDKHMAIVWVWVRLLQSIEGLRDRTQTLEDKEHLRLRWCTLVLPCLIFHSQR